MGLFGDKKAKFKDYDLRLKAAGVNFGVFTISDMITKSLQKEVEELKDLTDEDFNKVFLIVSYVTLFNAQKFFWENFVKDEDNARVFEKNLFELFEKTLGVNPKPLIRDIAEYIKDGDPSREIQYIGSRICRELNMESATLMMTITMVYVSFLKHGFFESMESAWNIPDDQLEGLLKRLS